MMSNESFKNFIHQAYVLCWPDRPTPKKGEPDVLMPETVKVRVIKVLKGIIPLLNPIYSEQMQAVIRGLYQSVFWSRISRLPKDAQNFEHCGNVDEKGYIVGKGRHANGDFVSAYQHANKDIWLHNLGKFVDFDEAWIVVIGDFRNNFHLLTNPLFSNRFHPNNKFFLSKNEALSRIRTIR